uniref:PilZ domain-containing protein n=1 Tax=Magnetococcus massalia (strain MO-1) TaxID=451514 RepID=A0A1S7LPN6_MAGMO|nr:Protein of unknown function [Candidatus Magnetococcus massalia]
MSDAWKNKRNHLRVPYGKVLVVRLESGPLLSGTAEDFSAGGFLLILNDENNRVETTDGERAVLDLDIQGERLQLPCTLLRKTDSGFAFQFIDR